MVLVAPTSPYVFFHFLVAISILTPITCYVIGFIRRLIRGDTQPKITQSELCTAFFGGIIGTQLGYIRGLKRIPEIWDGRFDAPHIIGYTSSFLVWGTVLGAIIGSVTYVFRYASAHPSGQAQTSAPATASRRTHSTRGTRTLQSSKHFALLNSATLGSLLVLLVGLMYFTLDTLPPVSIRYMPLTELTAWLVVSSLVSAYVLAPWVGRLLCDRPLIRSVRDWGLFGAFLVGSLITYSTYVIVLRHTPPINPEASPIVSGYYLMRITRPVAIASALLGALLTMGFNISIRSVMRAQACMNGLARWRSFKGMIAQWVLLIRRLFRTPISWWAVMFSLGWWGIFRASGQHYWPISSESSLLTSVMTLMTLGFCAGICFGVAWQQETQQSLLFIGSRSGRSIDQVEIGQWLLGVLIGAIAGAVLWLIMSIPIITKVFAYRYVTTDPWGQPLLWGQLLQPLLKVPDRPLLCLILGISTASLFALFGLNRARHIVWSSILGAVILGFAAGALFLLVNQYIIGSSMKQILIRPALLWNLVTAMANRTVRHGFVGSGVGLLVGSIGSGGIWAWTKLQPHVPSNIPLINPQSTRSATSSIPLSDAPSPSSSPHPIASSPISPPPAPPPSPSSHSPNSPSPSQSPSDSPPSSPNLIAQARQGNPQAIATLLSRQLQPKGITVRVKWQNTTLYVVLERQNPIKQDAVISFLTRGFRTLRSPHIQNICIIHQQPNSQSMVWRVELSLLS